MFTPRIVRGFAALAILAAGSVAPAQDSRPGDTIPATPLEPAKSRPASSPKRADIYDTKADGKALIAAAITKAAKFDKRVMLVFGGNWCGWCHKLHALFASNEEIRRTIFNEYEVVWMDIGKTDRNQDVLQTYAGKVKGYPHVTVLDSAGGVLTNLDTENVEEGDHHDPAKVKAFLEKWRVPVQDAEKVLADGLARAKADSKVVFFHVGAPWCGWCHKLEAFIGREDIARILSADFVLLKIDQDRMTNGLLVAKRYRDAKSDGIPWTAFLDGSGKVLTTSDGPKGNIGCPWEPPEIEWFMGMLRQVKNRITPEDLGRIEAELKKYATPKPASRPT